MSIFSFAGFAVRNPGYVVKHASRSWAAHKAMQQFRFANRYCAWCGRSKRLDVHHIYPVSVAPEMAADLDNMIMLCRKPQCHLQVGHNGDYARRYVSNVEYICSERNVIRSLKGVTP